MEAEREMTRLWRTFRTVYELLADRVGTLFEFLTSQELSHRHDRIFKLSMLTTSFLIGLRSLR
jgi:hypothetical protein